MVFLKKLINKFRPKPTIRKKVIMPVQTTEAVYIPEEIAEIIPVEIEDSNKDILIKPMSVLGKSKVNISNLNDELKIRNVVRPKPRHFKK